MPCIHFHIIFHSPPFSLLRRWLMHQQVCSQPSRVIVFYISPILKDRPFDRRSYFRVDVSVRGSESVCMEKKREKREREMCDNHQSLFSSGSPLTRSALQNLKRIKYKHTQTEATRGKNKRNRIWIRF